MSSPTERPPTTSIEDLPPELIYELFKPLSVADLVACSAVNKRWHSIYAGFRVHRLIVVCALDSLDEHLDRCEPSTVGDGQELIVPALFHRLANHPLLSNLRYLVLYAPTRRFDLNRLNRFSQLVYLEINNYHRQTKQIHLSLPQLEILNLRGYERSLSIDCPRLSTLFYRENFNDTTVLQVKRPETIRELETNVVGAKLAAFRNVERLVTLKFEAISRATLLALPKLKELRYDQIINWSSRGDRMKGALSEFLDDLKALKTASDFRFYFSGFQLTKTMLGQLDFSAQGRDGHYLMSKDYFHMKNYRLLEPGALDFVGQFDYTDLIRDLPGKIPSCFSQKYTGIQMVCATDRVRDVDEFLGLLKSLRSLGSLYLERTKLRQEFYDQLPASVPSLTELMLYEAYSKLNYDFIGQLSHLSSFKFNNLPYLSGHASAIRSLTLESLRSLVRSLGKLMEGQFFFECKGSFEIRKSRESKEWRLFEHIIQKRRASQFIFRLETKTVEEIGDFLEQCQEMQALKKHPPKLPSRNRRNNLLYG